MSNLRRGPAPWTVTANRWWLASLTALAVLAAPVSAGAVTTVGETAPSAAAADICAGASLHVSPEVAAGTPSYAVPAGGGVITSWSVQGFDNGDSTLEFKIVREVAANTYRILGADPEPRVVLDSTLASFKVRIPASAGDLIALWIPEGLHTCSYSGEPADLVAFRDGVNLEPGIGDDFVADTVVGGGRVNVSAELEPDADADGFGDETQDDCPGVNGPSSGCDTDAPETEITRGAPNKTEKSKVKFKFTSSEPGSTFECKLDKKAFKACSSPRKVKNLDQGRHRFKVRAIDLAGNVDPTPAKDRFKVVAA